VIDVPLDIRRAGKRGSLAPPRRDSRGNMESTRRNGGRGELIDRHALQADCIARIDSEIVGSLFARAK
jgi:hypothetical protein